MMNVGKGAPRERLELPRLPLKVLVRSDLPLIEARIVGGQVVEPNSLPFQISLQRRNFAGFAHSCGGSVYNENYIVDAAHCVDGFDASNLLVVAGAHSLLIESGFEQRRLVKNVTIHPAYDRETVENDISILELESALDFSEGKVAPIDLGTDLIKSDSVVTVSGWGALSANSINYLMPNLLRKVDIPVVSNKVCAEAYGDGSIADSMLCAGFDQGGMDSCQGDSGGPLFTSNPFTLVGIVSWGYGCAEAGYPGVYTRVADFIEFIESVTGTASTNQSNFIFN